MLFGPYIKALMRSWANLDEVVFRLFCNKYCTLWRLFTSYCTRFVVLCVRKFLAVCIMSDYVMHIYAHIICKSY